MKKTMQFLLIIIPILVLAGCAASGHAVKKSEDALRKRVEKYIQARIDKNREVLYKLHDSSFRKGTPEDQFINREEKIVYKSFSIESVEMLPSGEARVKLKTEISFRGFDFKDAPLTFITKFNLL